MSITPLLSNAIKLFLIVGIGAGGHQIYEALAKGNFFHDGAFYYLEKMSKGQKGVDLENKAYNTNSNLHLNENYMSGEEIEVLNSNYADFKSKMGYAQKMNFLKENFERKHLNIYQMIKDHTVKLSSQCQSGTGWFLDFELPRDPKTYPTKWFIATNLHVINMFRFRENPYNVSLPITEKSAKIDWSKTRYGYISNCDLSIANNQSQLTLQTEENVKDRDKDWYLNAVRDSIKWQWYGSWGGYFIDFHHLKKLRKPQIHKVEVKDPKLMYTAIDFLGPRYNYRGQEITNQKYFKDFGVIEVNFKNENEAIKITNKVFDKYYKNRISGKTITKSEAGKSINLFDKELMSKYDSQQLAKLQDNFFIGGYPGSDVSFTMNQKFKLSSKPNDQNLYMTPTYSKLTYFKKIHNQSDFYDYNLLNANNQIIPGHADINSLDKITDASKIEWDGKKLTGWGYNYLIDNTFLVQGSSGSMVLNQDGNLLGLYRMYNPGLNYGFVEPLRGSWVKDSSGKIILPGFDLIEGTGENVSSYRTQLTQYYRTTDTYLKRLKNWN